MTWILKEDRTFCYEEAKKRGEVDEDIIYLLDLINSFDSYVTLSSCSGRIAVLEIPEIGNKKSTKFLGKWHRAVELGEVKDAAIKCRELAWFIQYPPILHIACKTLEDAYKLAKIANDAGFRRCGLISFKNFVLEVCSWERIELPIAENGKMILDDLYLSKVIKIANFKLEKGKSRLKKFYELLCCLKT